MLYCAADKLQTWKKATQRIDFKHKHNMIDPVFLTHI